MEMIHAQAQKYLNKNKTYGRFIDWKETEFFHYSAQGDFNFFHSKAHTDTIARTHPKWQISIRVQIGLILCVPSDFLK